MERVAPREHPLPWKFRDMEAEAALSRFLRVLLPIAVLNTIATGMLWPTLPKIILANFNGDSARASICAGAAMMPLLSLSGALGVLDEIYFFF